jgi:hypothetical protein
MAGTFKFYTDAGLVTTLSTSLKASGSSTDFRLWFGSAETEDAYKVEADSDPGVDQITISITDSDPGNGHEDTAVKLALTEGGLATAVAGDPLDIGTAVNSGASNAVEVWVRVADTIGSLAVSTELGLTTNTLVESAVP